ncbi:hypothetical protein ACFXPI_21525 [Streptomyces sp. NPDC059104]|uniref:hypothetical protein n=1 Tax=Streptomyces sp. NPDC059104 TaxID=3346729 RepID=UPI0036CB7368
MNPQHPTGPSLFRPEARAGLRKIPRRVLAGHPLTPAVARALNSDRLRVHDRPLTAAGAHTVPDGIRGQ